MAAVDVSVQGRVQGVAFRYHTQREAGRLGVHGWVRNEPDGSVAGHFEGEPAAVDLLEPGATATVTCRGRFSSRGEHHLDPFSAAALLEFPRVPRPTYRCRALKRWPRGTPYLEVAADLARFVKPLPGVVFALLDD